MKSKKLIIALLVAGMAVMVQASKTDVVKKSFVVEAGKQTIIDYSGVDDNVIIEKHDKNEILFTFEKELKGSESKRNLEYFEDIHPEISFNNNSLEIEIKYPKFHFNLSQLFSGFDVDVKSRLIVPAAADLKIKLVDGDMDISGVKGRVLLKTVDGNIEVKECTGSIELEAIDGDIDIKRCSGSLKTNTVDGNVSAAGVFTAIDFNSVAGNGEFALEKGSRLSGDCYFHTNDGNVRLVFSKDMAFQLDFKAGDGGIRFSGIEFKNVTRENDAYFQGQYGDGKYTIKVRTGDGDFYLKEL
ncbi:MAG TPA: DUF4097 family beta strand repeat-containing protein [Candidatus Deferrimicrobium sp.]|nr:DUF4097 family beta strand repeat-containing protein [Candidatus Deferrimicrobium sp.]